MIKYPTKDNLRKSLFGLEGSQGSRQTDSVGRWGITSSMASRKQRE